MIAANLYSEIVTSIQVNILPIERIWKFDRKSGNDRRMCEHVAAIDERDISYSSLEHTDLQFL